MHSHYPLNIKIKHENNFPSISAFFNIFEYNLFLVKSKSQNIANDLGLRPQKKNRYQKKILKKPKEISKK